MSADNHFTDNDMSIIRRALREFSERELKTAIDPRMHPERRAMASDDGSRALFLAQADMFSGWEKPH